CLRLALSGHHSGVQRCLLLGVKRTSLRRRQCPTNDPERTSSVRAAPNTFLMESMGAPSRSTTRSVAWAGGRLSLSRYLRRHRRTDRHRQTPAPIHLLPVAYRSLSWTSPV